MYMTVLLWRDVMQYLSIARINGAGSTRAFNAFKATDEECDSEGLTLDRCLGT